MYVPEELCHKENRLWMVLFVHGRVLAQLGQIEEGLSEMLRWQIYAKTVGHDPAYYMPIGIAKAHLAAGRPREGLEAARGTRTGTRVPKTPL